MKNNVKREKNDKMSPEFNSSDFLRKLHNSYGRGAKDATPRQVYDAINHITLPSESSNKEPQKLKKERHKPSKEKLKLLKIKRKRKEKNEKDK